MKKLSCLWGALKVAWAEKVFKIWVAICMLGIISGLVVGIGMTQLVLLVAIACMGLAMEIANRSIEVMMDIVHPQYSHKVKIVKDLFGAVPVFVYGAYVISWLILVAPSIYLKVVG